MTTLRKTCHCPRDIPLLNFGWQNCSHFAFATQVTHRKDETTFMNRLRSLFALVHKNIATFTARNMSSATEYPHTSLSARSATPSNPSKIADYAGVAHAPKLSSLTTERAPPQVKQLDIKIEDGHDGTVPGFLHLPSAWRSNHRPSSETEGYSKTAAILLSGCRWWRSWSIIYVLVHG